MFGSNQTEIVPTCFPEIHKKIIFAPGSSLASITIYLSTPSREDYPIDFIARPSKTTFLNRSRKSQNTNNEFVLIFSRSRRRIQGYTIQDHTKRDVFPPGQAVGGFGVKYFILQHWEDWEVSHSLTVGQAQLSSYRRSEIIWGPFQVNSEVKKCIGISSSTLLHRLSPGHA